MTLAARPKPPASHRKRTGQHHKRSPHYSKAYWPYLPIIAVLVVGLLGNAWIGRSHHDVLGYATEMSVQNLLDGTNQQRIANGLGALALNGQLNQAAQAKASDMSARNYWSHNTPDGQTPWTFVTAAGYNYQAVGENLAYGFSTSTDTINGWMNSPGHRANILNTSYQDIGFGVINIPNYQNSGPQTLVVAFYGLTASTPPSPAPTPAPAASKPSTPTPTTTAQSSTSGGAATTPTTEDSTPTTPAAETPATTAVTTNGDTVIPTAKPLDKTINEKRVARVEMFTQGKASWSLYLVSLVSTLAVVVFLLRHALAWHRFLIRGERFVLHHPVFDVAILGIAMLGFLLAQTSGYIR